MAKSSSPRARPSRAKPLPSDQPDVDAAEPEQTEAQPVAEAAAKAPAPAKKLRPIDLIAGAKRQLKELTGYPVDSVTGFHKSDDGWALTVAVIELNRIPTATDVLAEYVVDLDADGDITAYRRGRRFYRGEVGEVE